MRLILLLYTAKFDLDLITPKTSPMTWDHEEPIQHKKWQDATGKEFHNIEARGIWKKMSRSDMPDGRRCGGFIKIILVKDNLADGFTKNMSGSINSTHITEFMAEHAAMTNT